MTVPPKNRVESQIRLGRLRPFTHKNGKIPQQRGTRILRVLHGPLPLFQAAAF